MKKYMMLLGVLSLFFTGINNSVAQTKEEKLAQRAEQNSEISQEVKIERNSLIDLLGLNDEQIGEVQKLLMNVEAKKASILEYDKGSDSQKIQLQKLSDVKNERMEEILTEEQYAVYLKSLIQ